MEKLKSTSKTTMPRIITHRLELGTLTRNRLELGKEMKIKIFQAYRVSAKILRILYEIKLFKDFLTDLRSKTNLIIDSEDEDCNHKGNDIGDQ